MFVTVYLVQQSPNEAYGTLFFCVSSFFVAGLKAPRFKLLGGTPLFSWLETKMGMDLN